MDDMDEKLLERLRNRAAMLDEPERPLSDATLAADAIERLYRNLKSRDDFIGKIGQWDAFVAQLT